MSDEWGPWIEHDGGPNPLPAGTIVQAYIEPGKLYGPWITSGEPGGWDWRMLEYQRVIRYRIRKPRALEQLRKIARNPERALEDA